MFIVDMFMKDVGFARIRNPKRVMFYAYVTAIVPIQGTRANSILEVYNLPFQINVKFFQRLL